MGVSDQQSGFSDQESYTLFSVAGGIFSVIRKVYCELILWEILSDAHVDDSYLDMICCANVLFHKRMQVEASFWYISTKAGASRASVQHLKKEKQGERQFLACGRKLMVFSFAVQIKNLIKCEPVLMFAFFIAHELRLLPYILSKKF